MVIVSSVVHLGGVVVVAWWRRNAPEPAAKWTAVEVARRR